MKKTGTILKMETELRNPVQYHLWVGNEKIYVNPLISETLSLEFTSNIFCIHCGRKTNKSFSQGYCYPCFTTLPETDESVVRPELNRAHEGISRNMEWSVKNDLVEHYVYLSYTSELKVGVTRHFNIPSRWIDQGAEYAIILAKTPYRQLAGLIEVALKNHLSDKTNWRKMLSGTVSTIPDLRTEKKHFIQLLPANLQGYVSIENTVTHINYPVLVYPQKIQSINFDTTPFFSGKLTGIKGQYLIFESGDVLNIRKFAGYEIIFSAGT